MYTDAILIGGDKLEHFVANLNACEEGPLDLCMLHLFLVNKVAIFFFITLYALGVVKSFDAAWELDKTNCANYFR